ncbi:MAG: helix-turn-helix domain-containing protein [Caldilineaceae bacterium]|nr:helix-turn-helix domain-containing protein [Caldilineaceae bacterium]
MSSILEDLVVNWQALGPMLTIRDEIGYDRAIEAMNRLVDEVGTDETHPLYDLLDTMGTIVQVYEDEHHPIPESNGPGVLKYLMEEHGLKQSDLNEVGSQGVVSEILSGKRRLNVRQIQLLSERFGVSPAVFF